MGSLKPNCDAFNHNSNSILTHILNSQSFSSYWITWIFPMWSFCFSFSFSKRRHQKTHRSKRQPIHECDYSPVASLPLCKDAQHMSGTPLFAGRMAEGTSPTMKQMESVPLHIRNIRVATMNKKEIGLIRANVCKAWIEAESRSRVNLQINLCLEHKLNWMRDRSLQPFLPLARLLFSLLLFLLLGK